MHYFLLFFIGVLSFSGTAQADCSAPAGIEGDQIFNSTYKTMQFCDGNNWYSMKGGVKHTLDILSCSDGQVAKWNTGGNVWECANDDGGITSESDPTVLTSVKDGVSWAEVTGKPAGFADGTDDVGIASESDPQVDAVTSGKWCRGTGSAVTCDQTAPSGGGTNCGSLTVNKACSYDASGVRIDFSMPTSTLCSTLCGGLGASCCDYRAVSYICRVHFGGTSLIPIGGSGKYASLCN